MEQELYKPEQINLSPEPGLNDYRTITQSADSETQPGPVLLLTIHDAIYPINTRLIERLCAYAGPVLRIVIFRKKCVQAMVEMDSILAAQRAKAALNGADIYRDCCTIKVEYAKPTMLNVFKNDDNTRDFTKENRHHEGKFRNPDSPPPHCRTHEILAPPLIDGVVGVETQFDKYGFPIDSAQLPGSSSQSSAQQQQLPSSNPATGNYSLAPLMENHGQNGATTTRVMVYDLAPVMNTERVFNYMCLYGNVHRVQFYNKPSVSCLVEYETEKQAHESLQYVNNVRIFGHKATVELSYIEFSNQAEYRLPDGTPNFADFVQNRNNRFLTDEAASKNRLSKAVKNLHFYNAPSSITLDELTHISASFCINPPSKIRRFKEMQDKVAGLLEYKTVQDAVVAICCLNHFVLKSSKNNPYTLKLCFANQPAAATTTTITTNNATTTTTA